MRKLLLVAGTLFAATAQANESWSSLWRTDDQRGEELLKEGDPASAAKIYADPRRKAYAELQAGDYAAAAKDFGSFQDSDAQYNRGNALAKSGALQEAVKAYDAALVSDPKNQDAQHNRDLVRKALDDQQKKNQQQNQSQQDDQKGSDQKQKDQQKSGGGGQSDKDLKQDASSQRKDSEGKSGQSQHSQNQQQQAPEDGQAQAGKDGKQDGPQQQAQSAEPKDKPLSGDKNDADAKPQDHRPTDAIAQSKPASQSEQNGHRSGQSAEAIEDNADQARRDVEASAQKPGASRDTPNGGTTEQFRDTAPKPDATPRTEQQLAEEQWMRRIPDDPGGLLRRKFMIEHMLRQKQDQQQSQQQDQ